MLTETSLARLNRTLGRAVDLMLANLGNPLLISNLCTQLGVQQWTLERLFKRHLKMTPSAYYRFLRLTQARNLLMNTNYRISEVGSQCGFDYPESFARAYMKQFGETASDTKSSAANVR